MNKNEFIFLPIWWQTFAIDVLGLRKDSSSDTHYLRYYELQGFVNALFLSGVIDQPAAGRLRGLVKNAHDYGCGYVDLLARSAA